ADRYTYIPSIGLLIAFVWGVADLIAPWRVPRWLPAAGMGVLLVICMFLTRRQVEHWHNSQTLWEGALRVKPDNYFAHWSLGASLAKQGRTNEAARHFRLAIQNNPVELRPYLELGQLLQGDGKLREAIELWRQALARNPDYPEVHHNLGQCL